MTKSITRLSVKYKLLIESLFILFLLELYVLGKYILNPNIKSILGVDLQTEVMLPVISLVLRYHWVGLLYRDFSVSMKTKKFYTPKGIEIGIDFTYSGQDPVPVELRKIDGITDVNAELTYFAPNNEVKRYTNPEDFKTALSPIQPIFSIRICLPFKRNPKPKVIIPIIEYELYNVNLYFKIGDLNKRESLWIRNRKDVI